MFAYINGIIAMDHSTQLFLMLNCHNKMQNEPVSRGFVIADIVFNQFTANI